MVFTIHQKIDVARESGLSVNRIGTTGKGIGVRLCDLRSQDTFENVSRLYSSLKQQYPNVRRRRCRGIGII